MTSTIRLQLCSWVVLVGVVFQEAVRQCVVCWRKQGKHSIPCFRSITLHTWPKEFFKTMAAHQISAGKVYSPKKEYLRIIRMYSDAPLDALVRT